MRTKEFTLPLIVISFLIVLSSCTTSTSDTVVPVSSSVSSTSQITSTSLSITSTTPTQTTTKIITYSTDHGKEQASVAFTIGTSSDGTITSLTSKMTSGDHESAQYVNRFNSAAKRSIIGRKISELSISAVGGASDTTDAFIQVISTL